VFNSQLRKKLRKSASKPNSKLDMRVLTLMRKEIDKICIKSPTQNQSNSHEKEIEKICIETPTENQTWCV
jgi:hypothetical protein